MFVSLVFSMVFREGPRLTATRAFSCYSYTIRVTSETTDVLVDPLKRDSLVVQPMVRLVPCLFKLLRGREPRSPKSIANNVRG